MISVERAYDLVKGSSEEEVRELVRNRILEKETLSMGSGHSLEPSEDVVIQLLNNPQLECERRCAVLTGCIDVYRIVRERLDDPGWATTIGSFKNVILNLCRVIDMSQPGELSKQTKSLLVLLLEDSTCPPELLISVVKAYTAFGRNEKNVRFWEEEVLTNQFVSSYAFNALLDIDPLHARIEKHLCELWSLQVNEHWPVDTGFLMKRAIRLRDSKELIHTVLSELRRHGYWQHIKENLARRPWTKKWLEDFRKTYKRQSLITYKKDYSSAKNRERTTFSSTTAVFKHGTNEKDPSMYEGYIKIQSPLTDTSWVDLVNRLLIWSEKRGKLIRDKEEQIIEEPINV